MRVLGVFVSRGQPEVVGAVCIVTLCLVNVLLEEGNRDCPVS